MDVKRRERSSMNGDTIGDAEHVARYCGGSQVNQDGTINGAAFRLKIKNGRVEDSLSVNWLEYLKLTCREKEISEIRRILKTKMKGGIGSTAKIAVLNVGETRRHVSTKSPDRRDLQVNHEPEDDNPSHSGVNNMRIEDILIADLIAEQIREIHPSR